MEPAQVFDPYKIQPTNINLSIKQLYNKQHTYLLNYEYFF